MLYEFFQARESELRAAEANIGARKRWAEISRVERLETALRVARGRANMAPLTGLEAR